jgi:predicted transport protein
MPLFKIDNNKVKKLVTKQLDLEKNLQHLIEANLEEILDITFLAHEYATSFGGRIDTLGIDKNGAPVIIEYKRNNNESVINQGLSYLRWLLDHKAEFEKLVEKELPRTYNTPNMTYNGELKIDNLIDWDSPRVICIAESYNKFDTDTADLLPLKIELLKYRLYDENLLFIETENYQKIKITTTNILKKNKQEEKTKLQATYTLDDHLSHANEAIKSLFYQLREMILGLDESIKEEPKKYYIAYKLATNFVDVEVRSKDIKIYLNVKSGVLNDKNNYAKDLTKPKQIGHWGNGDYVCHIGNQEQLEQIFHLIVQSYEYNK